jgi:hypothetical protein
MDRAPGPDVKQEADVETIERRARLDAWREGYTQGFEPGKTWGDVLAFLQPDTERSAA